MGRKPVITRMPAGVGRDEVGAGEGEDTRPEEGEDTEPVDTEDAGAREDTEPGPVGEERPRPEHQPDATGESEQSESEEVDAVGSDFDVGEPVGAEPEVEGRDEMADRDLDADEVAGDAGAGPFEPGTQGATRMQQSLDVLINTIPGEVLVLWAALEGAAELYGLPAWAYGGLLVVAALATPVYAYRSIDKPDDGSSDSDVRWWQEANVQWQSVSATGAFLVWVYYLGGPFQAAGLQNAALATVLVLVYPVFVVISPYYGSLVLYLLGGSKGSEGGGTGVP